jgi:hypothetical protein
MPVLDLVERANDGDEPEQDRGGEQGQDGHERATLPRLCRLHCPSDEEADDPDDHDQDEENEKAHVTPFLGRPT